MSTAPTGTWILTYSQDGVIRAMWIKGAIQEPTHWMPLAGAAEGTDVMPRVRLHPLDRRHVDGAATGRTG